MARLPTYATKRDLLSQRKDLIKLIKSSKKTVKENPKKKRKVKN